LRGVSLKSDRPIGIEVAENRSGLESEKEVTERFRRFIIEGDPARFLAVFAAFYKIGKGANDRGVVVNEASVKVAESEEDLNFSN
jgi:hypothetical protein